MSVVTIVFEDAFCFDEADCRIDFVGENCDTFPVGYFHYAIESFGVHDFACRIIWVIENYHVGVLSMRLRAFQGQLSSRFPFRFVRSLVCAPRLLAIKS